MLFRSYRQGGTFNGWNTLVFAPDHKAGRIHSGSSPTESIRKALWSTVLHGTKSDNYKDIPWIRDYLPAPQQVFEVLLKFNLTIPLDYETPMYYI